MEDIAEQIIDVMDLTEPISVEPEICSDTEIEEVQELIVATPDPNGEEEFDPYDPGTPFDIDEYDYETGSENELLDSELKLINAQLQWEESLEQVEKLVGWVILPLIGKVLGRRTAGISKYLLYPIDLGITNKFSLEKSFRLLLVI